MQTRRRPTVRRGKRVQTISSNFDAVCAVCDLCDVSLSFCINILLESFKCDQMSMSVRFVGTICLNFFGPELSFTVYRLTISMNTNFISLFKNIFDRKFRIIEKSKKSGQDEKSERKFEFHENNKKELVPLVRNSLLNYSNISEDNDIVKTRKHHFRMQSTRDLEDSETLSHVDDEIHNDLQHFLHCFL